MVGKLGDDEVAQLLGNAFGGEIAICSGHVGNELSRVGVHPETIRAKGAHADRAKFGVAQHDGVGRSPFNVEKLLGVNKIDINLKRRVKPIFPAHNGAQYGHVVGIKHVSARLVNVGELPFVYQYSHLTFAHVELCAVFYFRLIARKAPYHGVGGVISPFYNVYKLVSELVEKSHTL